MGIQVIAGAGPIGTAVARKLLDRGEQVHVVTRRGTGIDGVRTHALDLGAPAGVDALTSVTTGADALYNCVNPPYHQWATTWPPIAAALLTAAERTGAVLPTTASLYNYGRVDAPMTEHTLERPNGIKGEVRARMWQDVLAAHRAGRVRGFEVRGSDYLGGSSMLSMMAFPAWKQGKRAMLPAPLDVPHTFTDVRDVATLLMTGAGDERAWGRVWHVPSPEPRTVGEVMTTAADQLGRPNRIVSLPYAAVWATGVFNPFVKELRETQHQFRRPFVLDSNAAQTTFGLKPHATDDSIAFDIAQNWKA